MLIHCALQPVVISEMDNTIARIVLDFEIELEFIMQLLLGWLILVAPSDFRRFAGYNRMQPATGN
jgi:hypothetical protein